MTFIHRVNKEMQDRQKKKEINEKANTNTHHSSSSSSGGGGGSSSSGSSSSSIFISAKANKTCNNNLMSFTKPGNQKGKCPSCWPPIAQTK